MAGGLSPRNAQRASCRSAVSDGVLPLDGMPSDCEALYHQVGLSMLVRAPRPSPVPPGWTKLWPGWGYQRFDDTAAMVCAAVPRDDTITISRIPL